jgi:hypothetical protein
MFALYKMKSKKTNMEKKKVEQELSKLIALTIQLEDELNNCIKLEN